MPPLNFCIFLRSQCASTWFYFNMNLCSFLFFSVPAIQRCFAVVPMYPQGAEDRSEFLARGNRRFQSTITGRKNVSLCSVAWLKAILQDYPTVRSRQHQQPSNSEKLPSKLASDAQSLLLRFIFFQSILHQSCAGRGERST